MHTAHGIQQDRHQEASNQARVMSDKESGWQKSPCRKSERGQIVKKPPNAPPSTGPEGNMARRSVSFIVRFHARVNGPPRRSRSDKTLSRAALFNIAHM